MADNTKVDYDAVQQASQSFNQQADQMKRVQTALKRQAENAKRSWIGKGANEFQKEFEGSVNPTMDRLVDALSKGGETLGKLSKLFKDAEEESKQIIVIVIN